MKLGEDKVVERTVVAPRELRPRSNLWRAIYNIQGEAQQAAEGDRNCMSVEEAWESIIRAIARDNLGDDKAVKTKGTPR
jgi:hypothetical protein